MLNERVLFVFHKPETKDRVSGVPTLPPANFTAVNGSAASRAGDRRLREISSECTKAHGTGKGRRCGRTLRFNGAKGPSWPVKSEAREGDSANAAGQETILCDGILGLNGERKTPPPERLWCAVNI